MDEILHAQQKRIVKKRIMFNKEDDYYFITYNLMLFLCRNKLVSCDKRLIDYRKLAYIIPFISDRGLLNILENSMEKQDNGSQIYILQNLYYNTRLNFKIFTPIILALEGKGLIHLLKNPKKSCIDIWLNTDNIPRDFLSNEIFSMEYNNITRFNKLVPRNRTINLNTMLDKIFRENGVMVWES